MIHFTTTIQKFDQNKDRTGWTYIVVPADVAESLKPGVKKAFRVKGTLDVCAIERVSLMPMGNGDFLLALNATIRKCLRKQKGDRLQVCLQADDAPVKIHPELVACLGDEPAALTFFNTLAPSHKLYFSRWIESAKSEATVAKRIAASVNACAKQMGYSEMIRALQQEKKDFEGLG